MRLSNTERAVLWALNEEAFARVGQLVRPARLPRDVVARALDALEARALAEVDGEERWSLTVAGIREALDTGEPD